MYQPYDERAIAALLKWTEVRERVHAIKPETTYEERSRLWGELGEAEHTLMAEGRRLAISMAERAGA